MSRKRNLVFLNAVKLQAVANEMTAAEFGVFVTLLIEHAACGSLSSNPSELSNLARGSAAEFAEIWPRISDRFAADESGLLHPVVLDLVVPSLNRSSPKPISR